MGLCCHKNLQSRQGGHVFLEQFKFVINVLSPVVIVNGTIHKKMVVVGENPLVCGRPERRVKIFEKMEAVKLLLIGHGKLVMGMSGSANV